MTARAAKANFVDCPACRVRLRVPVKHTIFEAEIKCPVCKTGLIVLLGIAQPSAICAPLNRNPSDDQ